MPRILFDSHHCAGHALCHASAPEIYDLDENGYCKSPPAHIDSSLHTIAVEGADACPERALSIIED
ncbi:hypothetical protein A5699_16285 [Mycobacterium sp. E802]|uniref:ferredoxin n=1 Tax=Mycobacterium sp. E802 TaxID=1834152 RepID=UPI0007FBA35F|nr:ferredoxin [Mycobacterium sp. E802]OBG88659.1 hypothetical protein A5699_16285 [Mycobacterium sp. E802]